MAFVAKAGKHLASLNKTLNNAKSISTTAKTLAGWNKDFKPAPYPETDKAKLEAAKKYRLLPSEYRPYADDGLGYGDYPKLEAGFGVESRDPYYPYDFPEHKRNFHETFHADVEMYDECHYSQPEKPRYSNAHYFTWFLGSMAAFFAIYYYLERMRMYRPVIPKQYPSKDKKHYTFDS
ncbi:NADH dehydrogenase [ubiquinone] 1 beta subcomplex subunit 8, mitochondrial [Condylostylus longicornis]|uniref:NADH dehydrogenase [ubiquinone] 1 beta subcomplex subunit 8, mitochondrial n=1 Tax=Condylostylus longicornis TaxID=2530218 RepID=UPI00244DFE83|nr:NADH dehydrogenase [ubiquinone] 1 beta subcomplex subunit 8, mitochondrial [Condylostylus longicornis]XP_055380521.1 NADH dehydrogenase [ubiquinone] 1 beta subcomplex subunit 8, mitochondrial [Condylostylus longicornis]XP_055380522.1 NADH dehydrogenase [ubiquinone] 1 beta subcomplex subunit 8, mitochondrial [Condylostylus longicornis]